MKEKLIFISDVLTCFLLGTIIDYFADTKFVFSLIGLVIGIVLAIVLKKRRDKKGGNNE